MRLAGKKCFPLIDYLGRQTERDIHTVSVYFLGVFLADKLSLVKYISEKESEEENERYRDFLFQWYLTCLYHDIGYYYEDNCEFIKKNDQIDTFLAQCVGKEPEYNIFTKISDKSIFANYYRYIKTTFHKAEHGIIGGILLYKKLVENYYYIQNTYHPNERNFIYKELYFSPDLFAKYKESAEAIMYHNLWCADKNSVKIYKKYRLEKLIPERLGGKFNHHGQYKLLQFLLSLADTIEPTKRFTGVNRKFLLESIDISVCENKISIMLPQSIFDTTKYFNAISGMKTWLNVDCKDAYNGAAEINIIPNNSL